MDNRTKNIELNFALLSLIFRLALFLSNDSADTKGITPAENNFTANIHYPQSSARAPPGYACMIERLGD